jgi:hypothetical protein
VAKKKAGSKPATKTGGRKSSTGKKSAAEKNKGISDELIGETAGKVWHVLSADGAQSLTKVKKSVKGPPELVFAAVGWLAREGKLEFASSGRSLKVALRQ